MLVTLFETLRRYQVPVSLREWVDLLALVQRGVVFASLEDFYQLARLVLVKDERFYDRFDRAWADYFEGLESLADLEVTIPDSWLRNELEKMLSPEEWSKLQGLGSLEKIMEEFRKRLEEQKERHQGGNRWIGTGGTSPFGAFGANPEGIRLAGSSRQRRAVKVWERREFQNLDDNEALAPRNLQLALRRLRRWTRQGHELELDLDGTIRGTAEQGGVLDVQMIPERKNRVNVLLFLDVGGSMDAHVTVCENLFRAARSEFKHLEYFYFHNFIYESVWRNNERRWSERESLWQILHRYNPEYKVIMVGDATMSPYEVTSSGGSVEHFNEDAGSTWFGRIKQHFRKVVWLNPEPKAHWSMTQSTQMILAMVEQQMFELNLSGIEEAMRTLVR